MFPVSVVVFPGDDHALDAPILGPAAIRSRRAIPWGLVAEHAPGAAQPPPQRV